MGASCTRTPPGKTTAQIFLKESLEINALNGKVAVVTGAVSGMVMTLVRRFVEEGALVFISDQQQDQLEKTVCELGANAIGIVGDVGNLADLDRLYDAVRDKAGRIDILFAGSAIHERNNPLGSVTEKSFDDTFNVNVKGTLFTLQKALPLLQDGGVVILSGPIGTAKGLANMSVYNASKAAVQSFARSWTAELKARKIRVKVVHPGAIDAEWFVGIPPRVVDQLASSIPLSRSKAAITNEPANGSSDIRIAGHHSEIDLVATANEESEGWDRVLSWLDAYARTESASVSLKAS